ncbi:hypothetical protein WN51_14528 [Melipona quadrifasciata]|uniref:Uncharacterized protein n=1 Tax=Melipona quadrifasciata TaxID=166423 RepID=A0A0N0U583_9HYME|nr:hypothetical protein WN51_14528 [Melipona quadrifasciata]
MVLRAKYIYAKEQARQQSRVSNIDKYQFLEKRISFLYEYVWFQKQETRQSYIDPN